MRTEFFTAISLIATAKYNNNSAVLHTWCYKGRFKKEHNNIVGMTLGDMPVFFDLKNITLNEIFASAREQVKGCLAHKDYPYTLIDKKMLEDDKLCVIYQGNIYTEGPDINIFDGLIDMRNKYAGLGNVLDVEVIESQTGIELSFDYAAHKYKKESIEKYSEIFIKSLHDILKSMKEDRCNNVF